MRERITLSAAALRGEGAPPFTKQMTKQEALVWWRASWGSPVADEAFKRLSPEQQADLQLELSRQIEADTLPYA